MGRAAKLQSLFETAMTDFTEQLHIMVFCERFDSACILESLYANQGGFAVSIWRKDWQRHGD